MSLRNYRRSSLVEGNFFPLCLRCLPEGMAGTGETWRYLYRRLRWTIRNILPPINLHAPVGITNYSGNYKRQGRTPSGYKRRGRPERGRIGLDANRRFSGVVLLRSSSGCEGCVFKIVGIHLRRRFLGFKSMGVGHFVQEALMFSLITIALAFLALCVFFAWAILRDCARREKEQSKND